MDLQLSENKDKGYDVGQFEKLINLVGLEVKAIDKLCQFRWVDSKRHVEFI